VSAGLGGDEVPSGAQVEALSVTSVDPLPGAGQDLNANRDLNVSNEGLKNEGGQETQKDNGQRPDSGVSPSTASVHGTVTDVYGDLIPGATVVLEGAGGERQTTLASGNAAFQFEHLTPGVAYHVVVTVKGFEDWTSPVLMLHPGQYVILQNIKLRVLSKVTSVTVYASPEQIATQQVIVQEHQRVFGIIPNFYVTYEKQPVPLTTKLKFRLAFKADTDVMTFVGVAFISAIYQAGDIPDFGQGWDAYGKRMAAGYADTTTDIFIGGAILPWMLHQDPRYFYQGTGTTKSRVRHAVFSPFVCKGDNGKTQPNYSSMGGDLASGAISNLYYPQSNRGAGLVFQGFLITTGVRMVNGLLQEFVLRKFTPTARAQKSDINP
jgi:hypothetical protein